MKVAFVLAHPSTHGCSEIPKGFFKEGIAGGWRARAWTHAPVGSYVLALVGDVPGLLVQWIRLHVANSGSNPASSKFRRVNSGVLVEVAPEVAWLPLSIAFASFD